MLKLILLPLNAARLVLALVSMPEAIRRDRQRKRELELLRKAGRLHNREAVRHLKRLRRAS